MDNENNPSNTVAGANDVVAPAGNENVNQPDSNATVDNLSLEEINTLTGRQYASKDAALKGIKETFSFVGRKNDAPASTAVETPAQQQPDIASELQRTQASLEETQFYLDNPDYNNLEAKELIKSFGGKPSEVVANATFQKAFKAIQSVSQNDDSQTVMQGNSRQAPSADYQTDFEAAQASGNWAGFLAKHKGIKLAEE